MENYQFRIILIMALAVLIFGDFLGYGNAKSEKHIARRASPTLRDSQPNIFIDDDEDNSITDDMDNTHFLFNNKNSNKLNINNHEQLSTTANNDDEGILSKNDKKKNVLKLTENLRDSCLPKMICEIAAKSNYELNDKEKKLLELLRSTTLTVSSQPTKWHFAAHMGQLMRYTSDPMGGTSGCGALWPDCPFSSKNLMKLSSKVVLK